MKKNNTIPAFFVLASLLMLHTVYISSCKKPGKDAGSDAFNMKGITALTATGSLQVFTLAGDGSGAIFNLPGGVSVDANGNTYVADAGHDQIKKIDISGNVSVVAGNSFDSAFKDGTGTEARFNAPSGIALDKTGNLIIADKGNHSIRRVTPQGVVTTIAGKGVPGHDDLPGVAATFNFPCGVAVDTSGNIYVADAGNHCIRQVLPDGRVFTIAGTGTPGFANGPNGSAQFRTPVGIAVDVSAKIYVADRDNNAIRQIASGRVSTLAGSATAVFVDAIDTMARFNKPAAVAIGPNGNIYVADQANHRIRMITPGGVVNTIAGDGFPAFWEGEPANASFNNPAGIAIDDAGKVFIADAANNRIRGIGLVPTISVIEAGYYYSLVLKVDNSLWANGDNIYGQLGDGTTVRKNIPVKVMDNVKAVAAGFGHSLILKTDNTLWVTGRNNNGQLGDGTTVGKKNPVQVMDNVKAVAAGFGHSLILKTDNTLWAAGDNARGQLGDGTLIERHMPVKIMDNVKAMAAGRYHTLILKADNTLWVTGGNSNGQLGDRTNTDKQTPVKIMDKVIAIAAGEYHSMMLKSDNTLFTTGYNGIGQLGDGTTVDESIPVKIKDNVKSITAGNSFSLFLKTDNTLWATGENTSGQLGDGTGINKNNPVKIIDNVKAISAGAFHSIILKTDNTIWAAGYNLDGQLGDGTNQNRLSWVAMHLP